jgi:hypothetical protein
MSSRLRLHARDIASVIAVIAGLAAINTEFQRRPSNEQR